MSKDMETQVEAPNVVKGTSSEQRSIEEGVEHLSGAHQRMMGSFSQVIVGQHDVLEELLITVFAGGHNLL
ncbi:MAG: hypothetical protein ACOC9P_00235, partial [bacterium]